MLHLSLDPPIQTLADATFKLLRKQYWFDALLIIDESIISDQFARRLNSLCNSFRFDYEQQQRLYRHQRQTTKQYRRRRQARHSFYHNYYHPHHHQRKLNLNNNNAAKHSSSSSTLASSTSEYDWIQLKRSTIKKSAMLADTLLLQKPTITTTTIPTITDSKLSSRISVDDDDDDESIFEQQQKEEEESLKYDRIKRRRQRQRQKREIKPSSAKHEQHEQIRQSKAGLLMSIWKNLMIIRVTKSLPQKEVCFVFLFNVFIHTICMFGRGIKFQIKQSS